MDEEGPRPGSLEWATTQIGRVPYGEESRKYRRTLYRHRDWLKHRSPNRLFGNLQSTISSGVVRSLLTEVQVVSAVATLIVIWNAYASGWTDLSGLEHRGAFEALVLSMPAVPFTLSSPALGLLLVFRTNASYARWLEARQTWGRIVSQSRNIVRQATIWCDATGDLRERELDELSASVWAFPRCLCSFLRGADDEATLRLELSDRLGADAAALLRNPSSHRPVVALRELSARMDALSIDEKRRVEMDKSVIILGDMCEICERIFSSPVPLVYTRHTARFLSAWLLLLPLGLWSLFEGSWNHWATVPASAVLATFLFGIDELAIQLEEPFSILPLEILCEGLSDASKEMVAAGREAGGGAPAAPAPP